MVKLGDYVTAVKGENWILLWPLADWQNLTVEQQQEIKDRQIQMMEQHERENDHPLQDGTAA